MHEQTDLNTVELMGTIAREPVLMLIPPGATCYVVFQIKVRCEWPDFTGTAVLLDVEHECFAQGEAAEAMIWASAEDRVWLVGALDLIVDDYEPVTHAPTYRQGVRIHRMTLLQKENAR